MHPKVSVILPTYNRAGILKKSIQSVLNQSFYDLELIVVDDCSSDNTQSLISSVKDERLIYIKTPSNAGAAGARNFGIKHAAGEYIAFEDSDDIWHKDKLEKQLGLMDEHPECGMCYHKIAYDMGTNEHGQSLVAILPDESVPLAKKSGEIFPQLLFENLCGCPSMMIRRTALEQTGCFDEDLKALEDYDLALRLSELYPVCFVDEILVDSSFSLTGVSGSPVNYLTASCLLLAKYKAQYLRYKMFDHRLEIILKDSEAIGLKDQFVSFLEKILG